MSSIFSSYYHATPIKFNMKALLRDIYIYLFTLAYLVVIIQDYSIGLVESLTLTGLWPFYVFYSLKNQTLQQESLDDSLSSINTKIPFTKAYESFQRNKNNTSYQPVSSEEMESSDEELDNLMKKRNNHGASSGSWMGSKMSKLNKKM